MSKIMRFTLCDTTLWDNERCHNILPTHCWTGCSCETLQTVSHTGRQAQRTNSIVTWKVSLQLAQCVQLVRSLADGASICKCLNGFRLRSWSKFKRSNRRPSFSEQIWAKSLFVKRWCLVTLKFSETQNQAEQFSKKIEKKNSNKT